MYAQAVLKPNTLLRNGAYGIVMVNWRCIIKVQSINSQ